MHAPFGPFAFFLICAITSIADAQKGTRAEGSGCTLNQSSPCNHTLTVTPTMVFPTDNNTMYFSPTRPGVYVFRYEATDLCKTASQDVEVVARCPPSPIPMVSISTPVIRQGESAKLSSTGTKAGYAGASITSFAWRAHEVPKESSYYQASVARTVLGTGDSFTSSALTISGTYKFTLSVSDGCSTSEAIVCFRVECNCGPTANAGATPTIWTNTGSDENVNGGSANNGDNVVRLTDKATRTDAAFRLDGSLSYDFDASELLSYTWDFVSWASLNQQLWQPDSVLVNGVPTTTLQTVCSVETSSSVLIRKSCLFKQLSSVQSSGSTTESSAIFVGKPVSDVTTTSEISSVPLYITSEERFSAPTTSCDASVNTTTTITKTKRTMQRTITNDLAQPASATDLCAIRIAQHAKNTSVLAANNPLAYLSLSNLKACRGVWRFRLTVKDGCGSVTSSSDEIAVTVRCNEPPVAVAGKQYTMAWKGTAFEQVRLDGRQSSDPDLNFGSLTYTWTFDDPNSLPTGFCPQPHKPCVESFCQGALDFTTTLQDGLVFGPSNGIPKTACAPTVYPKIYRMNNQGIPTVVAPTEYFIGNTAYFTPTTKGTYTVRLTVDDGCSSSFATVSVYAICPTLSAVVTLSETVSTLKQGVTAAINIASQVFYEGDSSYLSYQWSVTAGGKKGNTRADVTFLNSAGSSTGADSNTAGAYNIVLSITDNCQTVNSPTVTWQVVCSAVPATPIVFIVSPTPTRGSPETTIFFDGINFPAVTLKANSTDSDGDRLTYSWSINGAAATGATFRDGEMTFTPTNTGGLLTHSVSVTASDGCSTSPAASIQLQLQCQGVLTASAGRSSQVTYDYAAGTFPEASFSAAESTWPYNTVAGSFKDYNWSTITTRNGSAVAVLQGTSATNQEQFRITPTQVGTYALSLTITDRCSTATAQATLTAICDGFPQAQIKEPTVAVFFNSYLGTSGGFPEVTIDGSGSTSPHMPSIQYNWLPTSGLRSAGSERIERSAQVVLSPQAPGETEYTLTVSNGPCPPSNIAKAIISAQCGTLSALLASPGSSFGSATYQRSVIWDGVAFPTVCLDGTQSSYNEPSGRDAVGMTGNWAIMKTTWKMTLAPERSVFMARLAPVITTGAPEDTPYRDTLSNQSTASVEITIREWDRTTTTTSITTETHLANHHHNKPYTCFKPDLAGAYQIMLSLTDGCVSSQAAASITASCNAPATVSFDAGSMSAALSGSKFTRASLKAAVIPSIPGEVMTYRWTLVAKPNGSKLLTNMSTDINNFEALDASFVPDVVGEYQFSLTVSGLCGEPVTATTTVLASCASDIQVAPPTTTPALIDYPFASENDAAVVNKQMASASSLAQQKHFKMVGRTTGDCAVVGTRWSFVERKCAPSFMPTSVPPTQACKPTYTCSWQLVDQPCTDQAVNPYYMQPLHIAHAGNQSNFSWVRTAEGTWKSEEQHDGTTNSGYSMDGNATAPPQLARNLHNGNWNHNATHSQQATESESQANGLWRKNFFGIEQLVNPWVGNQCHATFKCRYPGMYKMKLTMADGCHTTSQIVTINCRCSSKVQADAGVDQFSYKTCDGNNGYAYRSITLSGKTSLNRRHISLDTVQGCPVSNACTKFFADGGQCCESSCCRPPCPSCPSCPSCPACPRSRAGSRAVPGRNVATGARRLRAPAAVPGAVSGIVIPGASESVLIQADLPGTLRRARKGGKRILKSQEEIQLEGEMETQLFAVVLPMCVVLVMSVIGNVVLAKHLRAPRGKSAW